MEVKRKRYTVPVAPVVDRRFDVATLSNDRSWILTASPPLLRERDRLAEWGASHPDPIGSYRHGVLDLPEVTALASAIRARLDGGFGVAWVCGMPVANQTLATSLLYLAVGTAMGPLIETYGRLYDVVDSGESYREKAIPVSQTKESTGMHTDSSRLDNIPDYVGLLCLRHGRSGGASRIASAVQVHEALRRRDPKLLAALYRDFIRDVVTPGADRAPLKILENRFPIFRHDGELTMRYMRYWIETGHRAVGVPLEEHEITAMDALDEELARDTHMFRFQLESGDMLWVANRIVAHDRDGYTEDPDHPRWLVRQWVRDRGR